MNDDDEIYNVIRIYILLVLGLLILDKILYIVDKICDGCVFVGV